MNMQDQTRKAFGHYASRAHARATAGEKGMVGSRLNPLLMKRGDDLELPVISSVADDSLLTDDQLAEITANIDDAVERYKKHSVNGPVFGESISRVAVDKGFLGDVSVIDHQMAMNYDGDTLPDEKSYRRLVKRARGYEAGNRTDDYVQPPKVDEYVQPPKDMSFTDALIGRDDNKAYVDDHMRSLVNADDTIFVSPEAAKEMGSVFVDDFGNRGKVVTKDQVGKQARDYTAGNLTDDYIKPPKYDDYVQPPMYNDYVQPPMDTFDASQFEMANDEATKSIDDVPMGIDEGQFDMTPIKGLQQ